MKPIFLLLVAALSGCASTPVARSAAVKPATAEAVASCEYLDDLAGASGRYGVFASSGAEKARMDLMRSEEHTSELQSLMRISYAVFCLKKKKYILAPKNKTVTPRHVCIRLITLRSKHYKHRLVIHHC